MPAILRSLLVTCAALTLGRAYASPTKQYCPPVSGNITISEFQLYPENADSNPENCLVYLSILFNSSVAVYDPYCGQVVDTITFPGLTGNPSLHLSGVAIDPYGQLSAVVDAGVAFDTSGQNISGDNFLVKYDLTARRVLWQKNLTAVTDGIYGGFQDVVHDSSGNAFVVGTFPSSIIRVSSDGQTATPWFLQTPPDHTVHGLTGLAAHNNALLASDNSDGQLYRFDIRAENGTRVRVPLTGSDGPLGQALDAIHLPPRFGGKVLLVSDNTLGTIVLRSSDGSWSSAEWLTTIPNSFLSQGGSAVATVEIGGSLYAVTEFFGDVRVQGTLAGNRTEFPLVDITAEVVKVLGDI